MADNKEKISFDLDSDDLKLVDKTAEENGDIGRAAQLRIIVSEWVKSQKKK